MPSPADTTLLFISLHGPDDPTKAAWPFLGANGSLDAGYRAQIFLSGDAVLLMKDVIAQHVFPLGWKPLTTLIHGAISRGAVLYI